MIHLLAKLFIRKWDEYSDASVRQAYGKLCSGVGIAVNTVLFLMKVLMGHLCGSASMAADGFNNLADAVTSAVMFLGFMMAGVGAGKNHPFGHGRYEWLMGIFAGMGVMGMGAALARTSIAAISSPGRVEFGAAACAVLVCSILAKLSMYCYNKRYGKILGSSAMKAAAADSIGDMAATSSILLALAVQRLTGWAVDGWCGLLVSVFIFVNGFKSVSETVERLLGQAPDQELMDRIVQMARSYPEVRDVSGLAVHDYGMGHLAVSMHLEGSREEDQARLYTVVHEMEYHFYRELGCEAAIQVDIMDSVERTPETLMAAASKCLEQLEIKGEVREARAVKSGLYTDIFLTIIHPRRQQSREPEIRKAVEQALSPPDGSCRLVVRFLVGIVRS